MNQQKTLNRMVSQAEDEHSNIRRLLGTIEKGSVIEDEMMCSEARIRYKVDLLHSMVNERTNRIRELEVRANDVGISILEYDDLDLAAVVISKLIDEGGRKL